MPSSDCENAGVFLRCSSCTGECEWIAPDDENVDMMCESIKRATDSIDPSDPYTAVVVVTEMYKRMREIAAYLADEVVEESRRDFIRALILATPTG